MILVAAGMIFAAGIHKLMVAYSPDLALYEHYANAALRSPLFHSLPREYPAAATALFLAPLALPFSYALGFALLAAAGAVVLVLSSDGLRGIPRLVTPHVPLLACRGGGRSVRPLRRFSCAGGALGRRGGAAGAVGPSLGLGGSGRAPQAVPFPAASGVPDRRARTDGQMATQETMDCLCTGCFA